MTEIQNSKPRHHLKKESQICLGHWNWGPARRVGSPSEARTISVIGICLLFGFCDL